MKRRLQSILLIFLLCFMLTGCSEDAKATYDKVFGRVAYENYVDGTYSTLHIGDGQEKSFSEKYLDFTENVKSYAPFIMLGGVLFMCIFIPIFKGSPKIVKTIIGIGLFALLGPLLLVYGMAFLFNLLGLSGK